MLIYMQMLETADEQAKFEQVYHTYSDLMFAVANRILNNTHDAEDAVQQAFFAILKNFEKISDVKSPKTKAFIVTIVERKAIDLYRTKQRNDVLPFSEEFINVPDACVLEQFANRSAFAHAVSKLPAKYRELLFLKYDTGFSERELAELFSMSAANVNKTIQRAKKKLASILEEQEA